MISESDGNQGTMKGGGGDWIESRRLNEKIEVSNEVMEKKISYQQVGDSEWDTIDPEDYLVKKI